MTKRATATAAEVRRMIKAAQDAGLRVAGIKPDGTVVVYSGRENPLVPIDQRAIEPDDAEALRWGDGSG
jgi:hypothetical protein